VTGKGQKPLAVNGMPDHVHVLVGLRPAMRIADLIRDIKNNSSNFINDKGWLKKKFPAGRIWRIFLFRIQLWKGDRLYKKSEETPRTEKFPAGIFTAPGEIQYSIRGKIFVRILRLNLMPPLRGFRFNP